MAARDKLIPLIVAFPLFLQNLDTSVMSTALPAIAGSLQVEPLRLNLAITAYLLSLAVFLPLSGWTAERFGARAVFCTAIGLFSLGSALCGAADSLGMLVACRVLQGLGGAMMIPVGRLILLRGVPASQMVAAMVWFTIPPAVGRMVGPLFGGAIVTWASWRWIFLVNVPFGLLGIAMALFFIRSDRAETFPQRLDWRGFVLLALGLTALLGGLETVGRGLVQTWLSCSVAALGALALIAYHRHSRAHAEPIVNLQVLRQRTFHTSVVGGTPLRIAIGAAPFLLPLMLQLGFGMSPLDSGLLTVATAVGSLATRALMVRTIRWLGFRTLLIGATVLTGLFYVSYGLFRPTTPHLLMFVTLLLGGLVNSMCLVSLQTLGFAGIPKNLMSHATTLATMAAQVSISFGVVVGAALVSVAAWWRGGDAAHLIAADFAPAFMAVGLMTLVSLLSFRKLRKEDGGEMR